MRQAGQVRLRAHTTRNTIGWTLILGPALTVWATTPLGTQHVATGVTEPLYVTAPPNDFSRAFIVGKNGVIHILQLPANTLLPTPFLTVPGVNDSGEQGLLGLAFHPNYATNGYFYVNYNPAANGNTLIVRYTRSAGNPNIADPASALTIMRIVRSMGTHNGGWTAFGADGYLYVSVGDGAGSAQDLTGLGGKILRIDVNGDSFPTDAERNYVIPPGNPFVGTSNRPEIWAYGLRNPWRCGFDPATGDLYIADVGQSAWEEIDFHAAAAAGGQNYGWPCYEGNATFQSTDGCTNPATLTFPFLVYGHAQAIAPTMATGCAITGGEVYRGCSIPDLVGTYFFSDYCSARIFSLHFNGTTISNFAERTAELVPTDGSTINTVVAFGHDAFGELYLCDIADGDVFKIVRATPPDADCNANGREDACDIRAGLLHDTNGNGIPDECEGHRPGDVNGDGHVDLSDLAALLASYGRCQGQSGYNAAADFDGDHCVALNDLAVLLAHFGT